MDIYFVLMSINQVVSGRVSPVAFEEALSTDKKKTALHKKPPRNSKTAHTLK